MNGAEKRGDDHQPTIFGRLTAMWPQIAFDQGYKNILERLKNALDKRGAPTDPDDPTVALADSWAIVCDVLGFYRERLANETYIGTAQERRSVIELARAVGYSPNPGLSASCLLYYKIETGVVGTVTIPAGSKVRAIPLPGEVPLVFETHGDLVARPDLNAIRLFGKTAACISEATQRIYLAGVDKGLKAGDLLLVHRPIRPDLYFLASAIETDRKAEQTIIEVALRYSWNGTTGIAPAQGSKSNPMQSAPHDTARQEAPSMPKSADWTTTPAYYHWRLSSSPWIEANILSKFRSEPKGIASKASTGEGLNEDRQTIVVGFRRRAMVFGHNAPRRPRNLRNPSGGEIDWTLDPADIVEPDRIDLDGHHPSVVPESQLCIEIPGRSVHGADLEVYTVKAVELISRSAYGITGNVTRIRLDRPWKSPVWREDYQEIVQRAIVHLEDVPMELGWAPGHPIGPPAAEQPGRVPTPHRASDKSWVVLDGVYLWLEPGRKVILDGDPPSEHDRSVDQQPEVLTIAEVEHPNYPGELGPKGRGAIARPPHTKVRFKESLRFRYEQSTVKLYANVVEATHGEAYEEILGSGDGAREFQAFQLSRKPLTHLPRPQANGSRAEIGVYVGGQEWEQVDSMLEDAGTSRIFAVAIDDTANARVYFGDGQAGARLPTGRENVSAKYRVGLGRAGNIARDRLKLPVDHPLGVQEVSNLRSVGGSDPEPISRIRANAPRSTSALDRLVTEADYLGVARTFPGIAKADVFRSQSSTGDIVVVSVLDERGVEMEPENPILEALHSVLTRSGDGLAEIVVCSGEPRTIKLGARVTLVDRVAWTPVEDRIQTILGEMFGFERRELGQTAYASEVLAAIQSVDGVAQATLHEFHCFENETGPDWLKAPGNALQAAVPAAETAFDLEHGRWRGSQLMIVRPACRGTIVLVQA